MIKCKLHPYEQGEGVCASCLRDRLLVLHAAQHVTSPEIHRPPPPALSSYVSHRLSNDYDAASDASHDRDHHGHRRFYHTPQIVGGRNQNGCRSFSKLSSLFHHHHRHRSDESEPSASWFSSLIHGRRNKKNDTRSPSSPPALRKVKTFGALDRGMSPTRGDEAEDNASESGYSTESSSATWRRPALPRRATAESRRRNGGVFSGFAICLSPLVRAGPTSGRSHVPELGFSGEVRGNGIPAKSGHVSGFGGSFGPNRSRKLADGGRFR